MVFDNNNLLIKASSIGNLGKVKELLDNGARTYARGYQGNTPLHVAAMNGHLNVVKELLTREAAIYSHNNDDLTSFELANNKNKSKVVNFLFNCKDNHSAAENNNTNLISPLLGKEAEVDDKDSYNGTDYIKGEVTNRANSPFSLVNSLLSWVKNSISGLLSSRAALPETSANYSNIAGTSQFSSEVCISNNVGLGFFLLQSFLDKKYPLPEFCSVTHEEALADTLNIAEKFEKTLKKTAKQSGVSVKDFDFFKVYLDIASHVRNERYYQIPSTLYSATKEICPKNEKFLSILKGNIEKMFDEQQIVNSGYQV